MRIGTIAFGVLLAANLTPAQQSTPQTPWPAQLSVPSSSKTAYYAEPGVTTPELLPIKLDEVATGHCKRFDGSPVLSAVIDAEGVTHQVYFLKPTGDDLDKIAIKVLKHERFKPGTRDGAPVATIVSIELNMKACIEKRKNEAGQTVYALALRSLPDETIDLQLPPHEGAKLQVNGDYSSLLEAVDATPRKVGGDIAAPKPIKAPDPAFSDYARRNKIQGPCTLSLIVDANGMPQNVRIAKSLEASLDEKALETVERWRFKPAMKNGTTPVPVMITVEVDFHLF